MKQRLLLCLLMLMVSVGLVKAASNPIQISIPKTDKAVTIKITSLSNGFNAGSYPVFDANNHNKYVKGNIAAGLATYEIPAADTPLTISLQTGYVEAWGELEIAINGKVTSFVASETNDFSKKVTKLEFTGNGELSSITLGNTASTNYFPNLKTLNCEGNKLSSFPAAGEGQTFNIGTQTPANKQPAGLTDNAKSFHLKAEVFNGLGFKTGSLQGSDLEITSLYTEEDKKGTQITVDADAEVNSVYHFRDANGIYVDARTYYASIKVRDSHSEYGGIEILNVPLTVEQATFILTTSAEPVEAGSIILDPNKTDGLVKGDQIKVRPQPKTEAGYSFDKFEPNKGLKLIKADEGNQHIYEVVGNIDPELKVVFKKTDDIIPSLVTTTNNGSIELFTENNVPIESGKALTAGTKVKIQVKANQGYEVESVTLNGTAVTDDQDANADGFIAVVTVPAEKFEVKASFKTASAPVLSIIRDDYWGTFDVVDAKGTKYCTTQNTAGAYISQIEPNTTLTFTMKLQSAHVGNKCLRSLVISGTSYEPKDVEAGHWTFTYTTKDVSETVTLELVDLTPINIKIIDDLVFNGSNQAVKYETDPKVDGIKVEYKTEGSDTYVEKSPFSKAGTYTVRFSRPADKIYKAIDNVEKTYTIKQAQLEVIALPEVTKDASNNLTITGGEAGYRNAEGKLEPVAGHFVALDNGGNEITAAGDDLNPITVRFKADDMSNFDASVGCDAQVAYGDKKDQVIEVEAAGDGILVLKNKERVLGNNEKLPMGTVVSFARGEKLDKDIKDDNCKVYITDEEGNAIGNETGYTLKATYTVSEDLQVDKLIFTLKYEETRMHLAIKAGAPTDWEFTYDGNNHALSNNDLDDFYPLAQLNADGSTAGKGVDFGNAEVAKWNITYYSDKNKTEEVAKQDLVNAGDYYVTLVREGNETYYPLEVEGTLTIKKATIDPSLVPAPTASRVNLGKTLEASQLSGQAKIKGSYAWNEDLNTPVTANNTGYKVLFDAGDNYEPYYLNDPVVVPVTSNPIIMVTVSPSQVYGTVSIVNKDVPSKSYTSGSDVFAGTTIVVTATPSDPSKYRLVSLQVGNKTTSSNTMEYECGNASIDIVATFDVIIPEAPEPEEPDEVIDPNSQYIVTVKKASTNNRGFILNKEGENGVYYTKAFEFTVNALDADLDKLVVTGATKVAKGKYRINSVESNTTVTVSLANPTELKVNIPREYKNAKDYLVGKVQVEGPADGKCYYGDQITLVAYPESGVSFTRWSDGNREQLREMTVTKDLTLKAEFSGTPTGIEDIESAGIYAGNGYIQVKNVANADLTVVSISGRIQTRQHLDGDVQVRVPAGVYVVVLESGKDVKRVKVIVR